jgi:uncharacterized protein
MHLDSPMVEADITPSEVARARMPSRFCDPLFVADWDRVLMIHFEVDSQALQRYVPFELDLRDGRAFVSLVAFTMNGMRPCFGGRFSTWLLRPISTHDFLNVRTYVRHNGETGIHFMTEWLSNRLASKLEPLTFGLPYRFGRIAYQHDWRSGHLNGRAEDSGGIFSYQAKVETSVPFEACKSGSLDQWLMERYTAFNSARGRKKFFRVWHPPWRYRSAKAVVERNSLLTGRWPWFSDAELIAAGFSPGVKQVRMGWPRIGEQ